MRFKDPQDDDLAPAPNSTVLGRVRQHVWLVMVAAGALVAGTPLTRLLDSFHGVVLERKEQQMYVAFADRLPRWVSAIDVAPGAIVDKERGQWQTLAVEAKSYDFKLKQLYERYASSYDAVIVRITDPLAPGLASTAVAKTDTGVQLHLPLWSDQLAGAAVGRHLRKLPGSWDPVLLDEVAAPSPPP
jgi:hypothetical protein